MRTILCDIEGTTTAIDFVHKTLFPYARARLGAYLQSHHDQAPIKDAIDLVRETLKQEQGIDQPPLPICIQALEGWIDQDRKHPGLKAIQGYIWEFGYQQGDYKAHLYPDVPERLRDWKAKGLRLAIYSSGSVKAQKLLFQYSMYGDLTHLFDQYFDTTVGAKIESGSYRNILNLLEEPPSSLVFLSDSMTELEAAQQIGIKVIQLCREDLKAGHFSVAKDFHEVAQLLEL